MRGWGGGGWGGGLYMLSLKRVKCVKRVKPNPHSVKSIRAMWFVSPRCLGFKRKALRDG